MYRVQSLSTRSSRFNSFLSIVLLGSFVLLGSTTVLAQITPAEESLALSKLYPGKAYSPYAQRSFPSNVYWGETHLHTGLSLDAGLFGATLGHEAAYRFALLIAQGT